MSRSRFIRQRGSSLVELIVSMALFALLSLSIGTLTRNGLEYLRMAELRAELSRQSLFALSSVSRELVESNTDAIRPAATGEPPGIVFASPRSATGGITYVNNRLQWNRWVCVYWDQPRGLVLRVVEEFASPTTFIPDPSPVGSNKSVTALSALAATRSLARGVTDFEVQSTGKLITLSLEVQAGTGDRIAKLSTQTTVSPRH